MNFHLLGDPTKSPVMMIHGGGNAWWNYLRQARVLSQNYHVILPTPDGHGEEYRKDYISTEDSAQKLIAYIDENHHGHLFFLCGVSLGGQIVIEMLTMRRDISQKAIIGGSICYPQPRMAKYCIGAIRLFGGLLFRKSACRLQTTLLRLSPRMRFPEKIEHYYIQDMPLLRKDTLYNMYHTYMEQYRLKEEISKTTATVMFWYGSKEMKCVKQSAQMLKERVPSCRIYEAKGCNHGYLAIYLPDEWLKIVIPFLNDSSVKDQEANPL